MAIITEFHRTRKDGVNLYITRSTENVKIRKVGTDGIYDSAIDIEGASFEYKETDIPVTEEKILDEEQEQLLAKLQNKYK